MAEGQHISVRPKVRSGQSTLKFEDYPLDKKMIKFEDRDGVIRNYPALHAQFGQAMIFPLYSSPPLKCLADISLSGNDIDQNEDIQLWFTRVKAYQVMLSNLLRLPHHRFWSTLVHNKGLHTSLESYLRHAQRWHDARNLLVTENMRSAAQQIHLLYLKVHLRMSNHKETAKDHITPSVFGQLIYDNYLFDIPKLMDLAVMYGRCSGKTTSLLRDMFTNVFNYQPRYLDDLTQSSNNILSALIKIDDKLELKKERQEKEKYSSAAKITSAQKTSKSSNQTNKFGAVQIKWSQLQDTIFYMTDIVVTWRMFLHAYPPAAKVYHSARLENKIVEFYAKTFPTLSRQLEERFKSNEDAAILEGVIKQQVITARSSLLNVFRDIFRICCIDALHDPTVPSELKPCIVDELIEILSVAASEKSFITDYANAFPFESDLKTLKQNSDVTGFASVDQERIDFVLSLMSGNVDGEDQNGENDVVMQIDDEDMNGVCAGESQIFEDWPSIGDKIEEEVVEENDEKKEGCWTSKRKSEDNKLDEEVKEKIKMLATKIQVEEEEERLRYNAEYDDEYDDTYEDDTKVDLISDKIMDEIVVQKYYNRQKEYKGGREENE